MERREYENKSRAGQILSGIITGHNVYLIFNDPIETDREKNDQISIIKSLIHFNL